MFWNGNFGQHVELNQDVFVKHWPQFEWDSGTLGYCGVFFDALALCQVKIGPNSPTLVPGSDVIVIYVQVKLAHNHCLPDLNRVCPNIDRLQC